MRRWNVAAVKLGVALGTVGVQGLPDTRVGVNIYRVRTSDERTTGGSV